MKKSEKKNRNHEKKKEKGSVCWHACSPADADAFRQLQEGILPGFLMGLAGAAAGDGGSDPVPCCILSIDVYVCPPEEEGEGGTDTENNVPVKSGEASVESPGSSADTEASGADPCEDGRDSSGEKSGEEGKTENPPRDIPGGRSFYGMPIPARFLSEKCMSGHDGMREAYAAPGDPFPAGSIEEELQEMYRDLEFFRGMMFSAWKIAEAMDSAGGKSGYIASLLRTYVNMAGAAVKKWEKYSRKDA